MTRHYCPESAEFMAIPVALCADDFGLSEGIDDAILDLIRSGRLTATSVMVAGRHVEVGAPLLAALAGRADIGLHLAFTDLPALTPLPHVGRAGRTPALGELIQAALLGRLDATAVRAEVAAQIARFEALFGRKPDFIDGHQHVHVLPTVREAVFEAFASGQLDPATCWMRVPVGTTRELMRLSAGRSKALVVALLSLGLRRRAGRAVIRVNSGFRGFTDFSADGSYGDVLGAQFAGAPAGALFMCHPSLPGPLAGDPIAAARVDEYAYLASDRFPADLARHALRLDRLSRIVP